MRHVRHLVLALPLVFAACADAVSPTGLAPRESAPGRPDAAISDATYEGGTKGFYFLAPLVAQPKFSGQFDAAQQVSVYVCALGGSVSEQPGDACLDGEGKLVSPTVVDVRGQHYHANWNMDTGEFPAGTYYRIRVVDNASRGVFGFADVYLAGTGKEFRAIDQSSFVPLLDGRTLPVKFRLEQGAVAGGGGDTPPLCPTCEEF
jgi:hypothetical protein